jgi:predicted secreted hydrolase
MREDRSGRRQFALGLLGSLVGASGLPGLAGLPGASWLLKSAQAEELNGDIRRDSQLRDARPYAQALASTQLQLPRDHGAHPEFRTEWWYFTGWFKPDGADAAAQPSIGIQITFFRSAPLSDPANPVRMAPQQLLLAHVAVAQAENGKLLHDQIARRTGLADTHMSVVDEAGRFELRIGNWRLSRLSDGKWQAIIRSRELKLDCEFAPVQPAWLQGDRGFSKKGPGAAQASHYITLPHMESRVSLQLKNRRAGVNLSGSTWMDHEWSSSVLDANAVGWDWAGLHGDDGSSLMVFRIRAAGEGPEADRQTSNGERGISNAGAAADIWQHAQMRMPDGRLRTFKRIRFEVLRQWTSPRTGTVWPVSMRLHLDDEMYELNPLMPDQELDSRLSTGTVYWEGAVSVSRRLGSSAAAGMAGMHTPDSLGAVGDTRPWGRGYLELTGYWKPMKL